MAAAKLIHSHPRLRRGFGLAAAAVLVLGLLAPTGAAAFSNLRIISGVSLGGGQGSVVRADDLGGNPIGQWPTTTFVVDELGFDSQTGVKSLRVNDFTLAPTGGQSSWSFTFNPTGAFDQLDPFGNQGTLVLDELLAFHDTTTGHFWTESFVVRATRSNLSGPKAAAHYEIFFTTDETGTFTPTSVMPTQCGSGPPNLLVDAADGTPFGVGGTMNGSTFDSSQMVMSAAACPINDGTMDPIQAWPPGDPTIAKTGIIMNLIAVPEPSMAAMLACGLGGLTWMGRRRQV